MRYLKKIQIIPAESKIIMRKLCVKLGIILTSVFILSGCGKKNEYTNMALECVAQQDYEGAVSALDGAAEKDEDPVLLARARGIVSMGLSQYDEAIDYFEEALSYSNGSISTIEIDVSRYLAIAEFKNGNIEGAIDTCSAIIGMRSKDVEAYFMRGNLYLLNDDYDSAIRDFNRVEDLDGKNPERYIAMYETLMEYGYQEAADNFLEKALNLNVKISDLQRGKLYYYQGDYDSAKTFLEKSRNSGEDEAILYLGKNYEALGDMNYAASLYKTYLEKNPNNSQLYNQLGLCMIKLGDYTGACEAFESGLAVDKGAYTQNLKFNIIVAYEHAGRFDEAKTLIDEYCKIYPDDKAAQKEKEFLKTR